MFEFLVDVVVQVLFEAFGEFVLAFGFESLGHALKGLRTASHGRAIVGAAILGCICGSVSAIIFAKPVLRSGPFPGISLIASPIVSGTLMNIVGERRRAAGRDTTVLATFWGAATFGLAMAAVRFLWVGRWQ